jgi:protease-4
LFSQNYLEINLNERSGGFFAKPKQPLEIFRVIEKAANDKKIQGIILNMSSFYADREHLWELRTSLEQFKESGKKICAFISHADMDLYNLATVADAIVMDELGTLLLTGYAVSRGYMRHSLEKLGIGAREMRYFEYKSAAESYTRDSMSEADRKQYGDFLDDVFGFTGNTIKNARNLSDEEFDNILNNEFMFSARGALERNLVDGVGRKNAVASAIRKLDGAEPSFYLLYGNSYSSLTGAIASYSPPKPGIFTRPPIIAVVYADGQTDMEMGMGVLYMSNIIRELANRSRVRAIVVRINSPGGSAEAADYLAEAIRYARFRKPVVVSMGEVAASGGYWAAIYANRIVATPYTITGSIGVIGSWFFDNGIYNKLGLTTDNIKRGERADLMTGILLPYRDLDEAEEERYKKYIVDLYDVFIEKVASGRKMTVEDVEAVAQGRIFSGTRAVEAGLVDEIGGISDALRIARNLANIPENKSVLYKKYPEPTFMDKMIELLTTEAVLHRETSRQLEAASFFSNMILSADILYRLGKNGQVMPILPMEFSF